MDTRPKGSGVEFDVDAGEKRLCHRLGFEVPPPQPALSEFERWVVAGVVVVNVVAATAVAVVRFRADRRDRGA